MTVRTHLAAMATGCGFNLPPLMICSHQLAIDRSIVIATKDTAKLSSKFQISIPKSVRSAQRWQVGQVFAFIPKGKGMLLVPVPRLEDLAGSARGAKPVNFRDRTSRV
jgi:bifunctional DNA-binding transcriptional regulator/antitoxin component of YhaV-PrlF toxin-antitoxin module